MKNKLIEEADSILSKHNLSAEPEVNLEESLEDLLAKAQIRVEEVAAVPAKPEPAQTKEDVIRSMLDKVPGAPTEAQIESWKKKYGANSLYLVGLDEENMYVYVPLKYSEWKKVKETIEQIRAKGVGAEFEDGIKEMVVKQCVLWPKLDNLSDSRAGLVDTMYSAISAVSYFLTPQQVMSITVQL